MKKTKINDLLPSEIIIEILSRMPVDSVLQCKRVCRTWRFLIEHDPTFLALHTHRFITSSSSSSSSSSSGGQLVIKSAPAAAADFSFFILVNSRKRYYSIYDNNELYFGEYYNNKKERKKKTVKLSLNSIPSDRFHRLLNSDNIKCITSCNGLILIASISNSKDNNNNNNNSDDDDADMFVFNPVTREYVHLPRRPPFEKYHYDGGGIGFGYHPITNEYKVVRITSSSSENCISVYTLGSGIWRKSKGDQTKTNTINLGGGGGGGGGNNKMYHLRWDAHPAVLLNGVLHWPTKQYGYVVGILSFDLADEELKIFPLPPLEHPFFWHSDPIQLGVLGGCLCWSTASVGTPLRVEIWVLNKLGEEDHNQEEYSTTAAASFSWTKKYSLSTEAGLHVRGEYKIVADLGGGKILFSRFDHCELKFSLVSCDPNVEDLDEKRWFGTVGSNRYWSTTMIKKLPHMIPYMKSFVSLKALGEVVGL